MQDKKMTGIPPDNEICRSFYKNKERTDRIMKSFFAFIGGICTGVCLIMIYLHRRMIKAAITGGEIPKAPESCPAFRPEDDDE